MLLRRDVMVGFLGLRRASAAACTPLAPEWYTTGGDRGGASGKECSDEAVEAVAEGAAAGFAVVAAPLGGVLLAGAAMMPEFERCAGRHG
jgi:hypothetical protein